MSANRLVCLLSHDQVNQYLAPGLVAAHRLNVQTRFLKERLPDGDCRGLVVDLDSVAPGRPALQRLVKELSGRLRAYPVAVFGYSLEDDQLMDLRAEASGSSSTACARKCSRGSSTSRPTVSSGRRVAESCVKKLVKAIREWAREVEKRHAP